MFTETQEVKMTNDQKRGRRGSSYGYSFAELKQIDELYRSGMSPDAIALKLERSKQGIGAQLRKMGHTRSTRNEMVRDFIEKSRQDFEQKGGVVQHLPVSTNPPPSNPRPFDVVQAFIHVNGERVWTPEDYALLQRYTDDGYSARQIADLLNRTTKAVAQKRTILGIKANPEAKRQRQIDERIASLTKMKTIPAKPVQATAPIAYDEEDTDDESMPHVEKARRLYIDFALYNGATIGKLLAFLAQENIRIVFE